METIRRQIITLLSDSEMNAIELSQMLSIREKEVYEHLFHIGRSLAAQGNKLIIHPYRCLGCGYFFKDRSRFNRPGRCPVCKGSHIQMATYQTKMNPKKSP
ncbi:MAG: transcriptional regulator [Desulfobulbaceae bacterium]|nr:transcriptional regulator [Desulfobulbaceae bacterium]